MHWYLDVLKKYAVFSGRARRKEYWMFTLFSIVFSIVLSVLDVVLGTGPWLNGLYGIAVLLPSLAVAVRRLHDTDRSGWWLLLGLVPVVGAIVLLVFLASPAKSPQNAHGDDPKLAQAAA